MPNHKVKKVYQLQNYEIFRNKYKEIYKRPICKTEKLTEIKDLIKMSCVKTQRERVAERLNSGGKGNPEHMHMHAHACTHAHTHACTRKDKSVLVTGSCNCRAEEAGKMDLRAHWPASLA